MNPDNARRITTRDEATDFLLYTAPDGQIRVECALHDEPIWRTQKRIAELFGVEDPSISNHLKNIFESGELEENVVVSILETTTQHGAIEEKTQAQKAASEYEKFNHTLQIDSAFDKMVKDLPAPETPEE